MEIFCEIQYDSQPMYISSIITHGNLVHLSINSIEYVFSWMLLMYKTNSPM